MWILLSSNERQFFLLMPGIFFAFWEQTLLIGFREMCLLLLVVENALIEINNSKVTGRHPFSWENSNVNDFERLKNASYHKYDLLKTPKKLWIIKLQSIWHRKPEMRSIFSLKSPKTRFRHSTFYTFKPFHKNISYFKETYLETSIKRWTIKNIVKGETKTLLIIQQKTFSHNFFLNFIINVFPSRNY